MAIHKTHSTAVPSSACPACAGAPPPPRTVLCVPPRWGRTHWNQAFILVEEEDGNRLSFEACSFNRGNAIALTSSKTKMENPHTTAPPHPPPPSSSGTGKAWSESRILCSMGCGININAHHLPSMEGGDRGPLPREYLRMEAWAHLQLSRRTLTYTHLLPPLSSVIIKCSLHLLLNLLMPLSSVVAITQFNREENCYFKTGCFGKTLVQASFSNIAVKNCVGGHDSKRSGKCVKTRSILHLE